MCGPTLNGNTQKLTEIQIFAFNLWDIDNHKYCNYDELVSFCQENEIPLAPLIWRGVFDFSFDDLTKTADNLEFAPGILSEGMVIRTIDENYSQKLRGRLSVKLLNQNFLLKEKE